MSTCFWSFCIGNSNCDWLRDNLGLYEAFNWRTFKGAQEPNGLARFARAVAVDRPKESPGPLQTF